MAVNGLPPMLRSAAQRAQQASLRGYGSLAQQDDPSQYGSLAQQRFPGAFQQPTGQDLTEANNEALIKQKQQQYSLRFLNDRLSNYDQTSALTSLRRSNQTNKQRQLAAAYDPNADLDEQLGI